MWKLQPKAKEDKFQRLINLRDKLDNLPEKPDIIVYEEVGFVKYRDAHASYNHYLAVVKMWCLDNDVQSVGVPVGTIKKHATGRGNAKKEDMLAAAKKTWPDAVFHDDNDVDARWIFSYYVNNFFPELEIY